MPSDDAAHRAWAAFDSDVTDDLLRAVAGAFALVASSDGEIAESEVVRFLSLVEGSGHFPALDRAALEPRFRAIAEAMAADYESGRDRALSAIAGVKGDEEATQLVISAAQIAIVADEALADAEETVLDQICRLLGVDPESF